MQLFLFVLSACLLALVSANGHNSSPQATKQSTKQRQKNPTVVTCLLKLKKCSRTARHTEQRNCLKQFRTCSKQHGRFMMQASIGGQKGLLAEYLQCLWKESTEIKNCITKFLKKVMKAEKVEKFQACTTQALLCYSTWEGKDMSKKPEACNTTLASCLKHIEEAPKGHEKAFPCYKSSTGQKVGHHKFVECLGENKLLTGQPKSIFCARKAYAGAKTCNETCQQSYVSCIRDGIQPVINRFQIHHVYVNRGGYPNQNRHVTSNHGSRGRVNPVYINRQGNPVNQGGYAQGNPAIQGGYAQGNQGGYAQGNQGGYNQGRQSSYRGNNQQGVHPQQNHGAGQQE